MGQLPSIAHHEYPTLADLASDDWSTKTWRISKHCDTAGLNKLMMLVLTAVLAQLKETHESDPTQIHHLNNAQFTVLQVAILCPKFNLAVIQCLLDLGAPLVDKRCSRQAIHYAAPISLD